MFDKKICVEKLIKKIGKQKFGKKNGKRKMFDQKHLGGKVDKINGKRLHHSFG